MMIELMEETANMLRGVCMDPRVPQDTREALWSRVRKLDAATEAALDDEAAEIAQLRERVFELEADPNGGDLIPLAEPRCGDLRRAAERCITAWTVVRGGVWDPNGLMDEHMAALRKALGPNAEFSGGPKGRGEQR